MSSAPHEDAAKPGNFVRHAIERDLEAGTYAARRFAGTPGDAAHHAAGPADPARMRTRFPPEPNGYLHVGHAKSIWLNFSLAQQYGGICHLRFDDTNPEKEEQEYVDAIVEMVHWLGYDWRAAYPDGAGGETVREHLYFASDYFDFMYRAAEALVVAGHAYVDEQSADEMRAKLARRALGETGQDDDDLALNIEALVVIEAEVRAVETEARKAAEQEMLKAATDTGLIDRAQESGRRTVEGLVRSLGYTSVVVE